MIMSRDNKSSLQEKRQENIPGTLLCFLCGRKVFTLISISQSTPQPLPWGSSDERGAGGTG